MCKFVAELQITNKKKMKHIYLLTLGLLVASLLPMQAENITVGGTQRNYVVYVPKNLGTNRPLLISCHGMNQDANYQKGMLAIESVADTAKFVTVFPNGIDKSWDIGGDRDINFITALIDEMVAKYQIDRNCVYLSGFSMGGMFTYHAMNKIPDKIAAFAPISGYPMGGASANANVRPLPIIHTHGTSDDVVAFSGVQGALNVWIRHNGCSTTPTVTTNYRGASHITRRVWGQGNDGVEVVLMEMAGKGHWISNDNGVKTGDEIWRFCKRYSLNMTKPSVRITAPTSGLVYTCFAPEGGAIFPTVTFSATANDPNGTVEKVEFFDGNDLIATCNEAPYTAKLENPTPGKHKVNVVATDNDGETSTATIEVTFTAPKTAWALSQSFTNNGGCVPTGWITNDGNERRVGFSSGYSQGCRILELTGTPRAFSFGLYIRNIEGKTRSGWAKYGYSATNNTLTLTPGHYILKYRICNWNRPSFSPVEIDIEKRSNGKSVASQAFTPTVNIGNVTSNSFTGVDQQSFEFDITEQSEYLIAIYTADEEWADCIIGQLTLAALSYGITGIEEMEKNGDEENEKWSYDLTGRRIQSSSLKKGLYIKGGKKYVER